MVLLSLTLLHAAPTTQQKKHAFKTAAVIPADAKIWIQKLSQPEPIERRNAAIRIAYGKWPAAVPYLIRTLSDPEPDVRRACVQALGTIGEKKQSPIALKKLLREEKSPAVRMTLLETLGQLRVENAIPEFKKAVSDPNTQIRTAALDGLSQWTHPEVDSLLLQALKDPAEGVRITAMNGLGRRKTSAARDPILSQIQDPISQVRRAAINALKEIGLTGEIKEKLKQLRTSEKNPSVLQALEEALKP